MRVYSVTSVTKVGSIYLSRALFDDITICGISPKGRVLILACVFVRLLRHVAIICLVSSNVLIPRIRKLLRVLIPSSKSSGLPSGPIAAVVSVAEDYGLL